MYRQYSRRRSVISIHALRKESDLLVRPDEPPISISIHALRKESDLPAPFQQRHRYHFNPRSP